MKRDKLRPVSVREHGGGGAAAWLAHIDGLRAVAVLGVVFYHAHWAGFGGGHVGVDIFFVISGFLIGKHLSGQLASGTFSLGAFYERRVRRIAPALLLTLGLSTLAAWFLLLPEQFANYSRHLLANLVMLQNFSLMNEVGYFSPGADLQPLLHTWSLAVEEQFYLFFPLLFAALWRWTGRWVWAAVLGLALLSGWGAAHWAQEFPRQVFYLMPARAGELLLGVLLASPLVTGWADKLRRGAGAEMLGGLALLGVGMALWGHRSYPDLYTLAALAGTAFLLTCAPKSRLAGGLLSLAPLRWVGLLSYSVYLLHQPVFVFYRLVQVNQVRPADYLWLTALVLGLAWLSVRLVEQPFRQTVPLRRGLALGVPLAAGLAWVGLAGSPAGLPQRLSPAVARLTAAQSDKDPRQGECKSSFEEPRPPAELCRYGADVPESVVLLGDSHAATLAHGLGEALGARGQSVRSLIRMGCPVIAADVPATAGREQDCLTFNRQALEYVRQSPARTVVVSSRWPLYVGGRFDNGRGGVEVSDQPVPFLNAGLSGAQVVAGYAEAVRLLAATGKRVVIVDSVPEMGWDIPQSLRKKALLHDPAPLTVPRSVTEKRNAAIHAAFAALTGPEVRLIEPAALSCTAQACASVQAGAVLYVDSNHLSLSGARGVVGVVLAALR